MKTCQESQNLLWTSQVLISGSLKDLTPEYALDNPFIEKMIFKDAKLPKSFIEQIVSRKGTYDEVFADMFGGLAL